MKKKLISLLIVMMLCVIFTVTITMAADATETTPAEPHIMEPIPIPTTIKIAEPTTEPTTIRTTEPTVLPTVTEPTTVRTTEPTVLPTVTEPTTVRTTEPTITITEPTQIGGGTGYFDIYVNVNGATVMVNGEVKGTTPPNPVIAEVYSTGAPATVTVSAPNYVTWSQTPGNPLEGQ
ncbi:MAG: S-layer protein, partial [Methanoregula sp.]|nr:S-layer protein [Methanoregula sp.]